VTTLREARRIRARAFGQRSETLAAEYLAAQGYRILARKFTIRGGEIDIVAEREGTVAFVEVKARAGIEIALGAITETKRRRLARTAAEWVARNPWAADGYVLRGDAVLLDGGPAPVHIEDAFGLEFEG
jgi:putative endonuclease